MKKYLLLLPLLLPLTSIAQNILLEKLSWKSPEILQTNNNTTFSHSTKFITSPSKIEWIQKGGEKVSTYQIVSTNGNWTNVVSNGSVKFNVILGTLSGDITFERTQSGLKAKFNFPIAGKNSMPYQCIISTIQQN